MQRTTVRADRKMGYFFNPITLGVIIGIALCAILMGIVWGGLAINAAFVKVAAPKTVTIGQLVANPTHWLEKDLSIKGTLTALPDHPVRDDIGLSIEGRRYILSDGHDHSVVVYSPGQGTLRTGKVTFIGDWVETGGTYHLEPDPGTVKWPN